MPDAPLPPPDDAANRVTVQGTRAIGPDGQPFAQVWKTGFFTKGETNLSAWLDQDPGAVNLSPSIVAVVRAVSRNEGRLEAVNSYDNCFMSFGLFQWTCGPDNEPGELPTLVAKTKTDAPAAYEDCFGRYNLDANGGYLVLNGAVLNDPAQKAPLRSKEWAYRFWRAGHSDAIRAVQCNIAGGRLNKFVDADIQSFPLRAWFSSEYAMALVLDEHVNRPGHVPKTLASAISTLSAAKQNPTGWSDADESDLIAQYLAKREATSMTDSEKRALAINSAVHAGELSSVRGSFKT